MRYKEIDFAKYSSIKMGATKKVMIVEDMIENSDFYLIGSASNTLVTNSDTPLAILSKKYDYIKIEKNRLMIGGATPSGKIHSFCKKHNIANFEYLSKLPGSMGGLVKMNAGVKHYEIFNTLKSIKTIKANIPKEQIDYGYRYTNIKDIIYEASFEINQGYSKSDYNMFVSMRANQPPQPSLGSVFKNPQNDYAGRLIQSAGLKGFKIGDVGWSDIHANFLVNYGNGRYADMIELISLTQLKIKDMFDIELEKEIIVI